MAETRMALNAQTETEQKTRRATGLDFQRRFTDGKAVPIRHSRMGAPHRADRQRQRPGNFPPGKRRSPQVLVADGHEHRHLEIFSRQAEYPRARSLGAAADRPRGGHDRPLGRRGRLLRHRRIQARFPRRTDPPARRAEDGLQFAGVVQRGRAGQAAVLRLLHQLRPGQHGLDHEPGEDGRHALQVGLRHGHEFLDRCAAATNRFPAAASPPAR